MSLKFEVEVAVNNDSNEVVDRVLATGKITNAMRDVIVSCHGDISGLNPGSTAKTLGLSSADRFGGIMCFEKGLSLDEDDYGFPITNTIIARGTQSTVYNETDPTVGISQISDKTDNSDLLNLSWFFGERQGNGTFSSVSLANPIGVAIGNGHQSENESIYSMLSDNTKYIGSYQPYTLPAAMKARFLFLDLYPAMKQREKYLSLSDSYYFDYCEINQNDIWYVDGDKGLLYVHAPGSAAFREYSGSTGGPYCSENFKDMKYLRFHRFRIPIKNEYPLSHNLMRYIDDVIIEMPEALKNMITTYLSYSVYGTHWSSNGYIHLVTMFNSYKNYACKDGDVVCHIKINMSDYSVTYSTVSMRSATSDYEYPKYFPVMNYGNPFGGYKDKFLYLGQGYYDAFINEIDFSTGEFKRILTYSKDTYDVSSPEKYVKMYTLDDNGILVYFSSYRSTTIPAKSILISDNDIKFVKGDSLMTVYSGFKDAIPAPIPIWKKNKKVSHYYESFVSTSLVKTFWGLSGDSTFERLHQITNYYGQYVFEGVLAPSMRNLLAVVNLPRPITKMSGQTMTITAKIFEDVV